MVSKALRPKVIIVGAGIGGLVLAILLEQAGVPYEILERATVVKPLGTSLKLRYTKLYQYSLYETFKLDETMICQDRLWLLESM